MSQSCAPAHTHTRTHTEYLAASARSPCLETGCMPSGETVCVKAERPRVRRPGGFGDGPCQQRSPGQTSASGTLMSLPPAWAASQTLRRWTSTPLSLMDMNFEHLRWLEGWAGAKAGPHLPDQGVTWSAPVQVPGCPGMGGVSTSAE